jgi:ribose transport system permease protein
VTAFAVSGAASALAALMTLSWVRVAKADTGFGMELDSIAACVVGGISLQGGSGRVLGATSGAIVLQALALCITMRGLPDEFRSLATGSVLLLFATVDALARRPR